MSIFPPLLGPIAPERNPPINPQYFEPSRFVISDLSLGFTTLVTTSADHNYVVGQAVRLHVPFYYGTFQINNMQGIVTSIPAADQVIVDIDSVGFDSFIPNPSYNKSQPQIVAIGDVNTGAINQSRSRQSTAIPGSFINISPL